MVACFVDWRLIPMTCRLIGCRQGDLLIESHQAISAHLLSYMKFEQRLLGDAWSSMDRHQMAGDWTMRTLEFHREPLYVSRRKYRELCFLRDTVWACNMIQLYLRVLYGTLNKPRFFPHTALNYWFLRPCWGVFTARTDWTCTIIQFYLRVFYGSRNKPRLFPIQH
jgi:hypothetical protein